MLDWPVLSFTIFLPLVGAFIIFFTKEEDYLKMKSFIKDSRELFDAENKHVPEYIYEDGSWVLK